MMELENPPVTCAMAVADGGGSRPRVVCVDTLSTHVALVGSLCFVNAVSPMSQCHRRMRTVDPGHGPVLQHGQRWTRRCVEVRS